MSALVTGAAGFLGAAVVRALAERGDGAVHALVGPASGLERLDAVREHVVVHRLDLRDGEALAALLARLRPTRVVHAAAAGGHPRDPASRRRVVESGIVATHNLLEAVRSSPVRALVHVGSSLEYGPRTRPLAETDALAPTTFRGVVKAAAALLAQHAARADGLPVVVLRPFSIYGPWEQPGRFVPTLIRAVRDGGTVALTAPGVNHDWIFVDDVVRACLLALERPELRGEAFNVGTGTQTTNEAVAALAQEVAGRTIAIQVGAHPGAPADAGHWVADPTAAHARLGFTAAVGLGVGLAATLRWAERRRDAGHEW